MISYDSRTIDHGHGMTHFDVVLPSRAAFTALLNPMHVLTCRTAHSNPQTPLRDPTFWTDLLTSLKIQGNAPLET